MELRTEHVTAFTLQGFEIGMDIDGLLVTRLDHRRMACNIRPPTHSVSSKRFILLPSL